MPELKEALMDQPVVLAVLHGESLKHRKQPAPRRRHDGCQSARWREQGYGEIAGPAVPLTPLRSPSGRKN